MEDKKIFNESLEKMKSLMSFQPGMTRTELHENTIKEEVAEEETAEEEVAEEETAEEEVKEEEVAEEEVKEDMFEKPEITPGGATNMAQGFVNESLNNKEQWRKNKQDRLNKKFGRS